MNISRVRFVKGGKVFTLPPGFKFNPSDEELVFEYLNDKISTGQAVSMIPDIDSCNVDPWNLLDGGDQEKYYFVEKKDSSLYGNGTRNGYWKQIGQEKEIRNSDKNSPVIGIKQTFRFYFGKSPRGSLTDWSMQQFQILDLRNATRGFSCDVKKKLESWRVIRVFVDKKEKNEDDEIDEEDDFNFNVGCSLSSSWSESSSEVTDVSYMSEEMDIF